ncbi:MAG: hypothetical protein GF341_03215 [candidate division Zixibacteria bacterium]|nr:hypothetical protein [candidate division Zixibacteria bacterium]
MRRCTILLALLLITAGAGNLMAAVPQLINFQSLVTDNLGDPIPSGTYSAVFSIYDAEVGGTLLWTETNNSVDVAASRFNVLLGAIEPLHDSIFDGTERWLGVTFDGEVLDPRTRLVSVGYAHRIATVDGASGGDIAGDVAISSGGSDATLRVTQSTAGAWAARFENTSLSASEPTFLSVANGSEPAVWGTNPWGGPGIRSTGEFSVTNVALSDRFVVNPLGNEGGGDVYMYQSDGDMSVEVLATEAANSYGQINLYREGVNTVSISGGTSSSGGDIHIFDDAGNLNVELDGDASTGGGRIKIHSGPEATNAGVTSGFIQLGENNEPNLLLDSDEILARESGAATTLHLQAQGGSVGIGTDGLAIPNGYIFAVDGKCIMEEVEVQLSQDWPDYVFEDGYDMLSLDELARHVKEKKHLPGIPSAAEMDGQRVPLGAMQTKLLEKVEELTLYMLALKGDLDKANTVNAELRTRIDELEANRQ